MNTLIFHRVGDVVRYQLTTDFEGEPVIDEGTILSVEFYPHGDEMDVWYTVTDYAYEIPHICIINQLGEENAK